MRNIWVTPSSRSAISMGRFSSILNCIFTYAGTDTSLSLDSSAAYAIAALISSGFSDG